MDRLKGKIAIVTGAASGIGAATAKRFAAEGAQVVVADINAAGAAQVVREIETDGGAAIASPTDLGDIEQIRAMVDLAVSTYGGLDVLHNNAAALNLSSRDLNVVDIDPAVWDTVLKVNLTGAMLACRFAIPHMLKRGRGAIVNTASGAYRLAMDGQTAYCASKAAMASLSRSVATQFGKQGIRANTIAPGLILTPSSYDHFPPRELQIFKDHTMSPALGKPEDIAAVALFLASDEACFVNGTVIEVDGGGGIFVPTVPSLRNLT